MGVCLALAEGHNLWAGSWTSRVQLTISDTLNGLYYCVIFIVYTLFTNVTAGRIVKAGGPWCGDP